MGFVLSNEEKKILIHDAFESIAAHLEKRKSHFKEPTELLKQNCGAFVTLHKNGKLRGCIGNIAASYPLYETIRKMAISSAFDDPRFPAVKMQELEDLELEISVLSPLREIDSLDEIEIGEHGIYLKRGFSSGLLLPQVATEQNWDKVTFLTHTCYKAGMGGDCWKKNDTEVYIFSAIIFDDTIL